MVPHTFGLNTKTHKETGEHKNVVITHGVGENKAKSHKSQNQKFHKTDKIAVHFNRKIIKSVHESIKSVTQNWSDLVKYY